MEHPRPRNALKAREELNPDDSVLIKYRVFPTAKEDPDDLALSVATALVPGVRTALPWMSDPAEHLAVVGLAEHGDSVIFEVAIPVAQLGGRVNIPQLLAIAWLPAEYERTSHVWIEDICLPPALLATIPGPHLGAAGLYASVRRAPGSPILQGILKPRFGGDLDRFLRSAEEALLAGLHGLVDDELMNDPQSEFSFSRRLKRCADVTRKAEKKTGQPKHYIPSIIAPLREAESSIAMVAAEGLPGFMTNSFALGYAGFQYLCEVAREKGLFVVDCSIGATLMSLPSERTGTSMELLAKLSRYSGADGAHTGSEGEHWYSSSILRQLLTALQGNIADIKPTLPVVAGEVNMANIWTKLRPFGGSCVVNVGAGFWHHPERPAKAVAQTLSALNCASLDSPAEEAQDALNKLCGKDPAFARAMDHFGYGQVDNAR